MQLGFAKSRTENKNRLRQIAFSKPALVEIPLLKTFTMKGVAQSGLEVAPHKAPEVVPQPDEANYSLGSSQPSEIALGQPHRLINTTPKIQRSKALWALAVIGIVCLAAALGTGLGVGRAKKRVSITSM